MKSNRQKQRFCHPKMADLKAWSHGVRKANSFLLQVPIPRITRRSARALSLDRPGRCKTPPRALRTFPACHAFAPVSLASHIDHASISAFPRPCFTAPCTALYISAVLVTNSNSAKLGNLRAIVYETGWFLINYVYMGELRLI